MKELQQTGEAYPAQTEVKRKVRLALDEFLTLGDIWRKDTTDKYSNRRKDRLSMHYSLGAVYF
eukprot:273706-Ditylum_brightwellii.AAC.1